MLRYTEESVPKSTSEAREAVRLEENEQDLKYNSIRNFA